ncbi:MAG: LytTR family DNA-binding domain-containing protein [Bacteroidota bacterium]
MKIIVIEDEKPASRRLVRLIGECRPQAKVESVLDSIERSVKWLAQNDMPDLIFMDIQLADGMSFEIFKKIRISVPVIFTTAFDQYTLKAFKVNSVDYLLKPIDEEELMAAFEKFDTYFRANTSSDQSSIDRLLQSLQKPSYKERFLVKAGHQLSYISVEDIAYFYSKDSMVHARMKDGRQHVIDYTLDQLEGQIDPSCFFRINRQIITSIKAIRKIHTYFNSRLKLDLLPAGDLEVIVSRDRVGDFKQWLDR